MFLMPQAPCLGCVEAENEALAKKVREREARLRRLKGKERPASKSRARHEKKLGEPSFRESYAAPFTGLCSV